MYWGGRGVGGRHIHVYMPMIRRKRSEFKSIKVIGVLKKIKIGRKTLVEIQALTELQFTFLLTSLTYFCLLRLASFVWHQELLTMTKDESCSVLTLTILAKALLDYIFFF